jgi:hypothetical protein
VSEGRIKGKREKERQGGREEQGQRILCDKDHVYVMKCGIS